MSYKLTYECNEREYRKIYLKAIIKYKKSKYKNLESIEELKQNPEKFVDYYNKISIINNDIPSNFRKKLRYLRECSDITREKLEEKSYISAQTIKEIENNEDRGYSLETIIALCIGMNLPPDFSFDLLRMAGFNIENNDNKKNTIYCFILRNLYKENIDYINEILILNNLKPLC